MTSFKTVSILVTLVATLALAPSPAEAYSGDLTFYGGAGSSGSCSQSWVPSGYTTVAMNNDQYDSGGACGTCVSGCYTDDSGETCFTAIVDNLCPECVYGDLDLGESGDGRWPLTWDIISCDEASSYIWTTEGSNQFYQKVTVEGGPSGASAMTCNGESGSSTDDGFFEFGLDACSLSCTATFLIGGSGSGSVSVC